MPWAKIDDGLHGHRKIRRAWKESRASLGLHLMALSYCGAHPDTNGFVDEEFVEEKLPRVKEREAVTGVLERNEMWHRGIRGWHIHDYLEYNPTAEKRAGITMARREAGKKGAATRWQAGGKEHG